MTLTELTDLLLGWPLVEAATAYGTPAFKVRGKVLTRLREDGDSLLIKGVPSEERAMLVEAEPELFYYTDHYRDYPMVLIRLSRADSDRVSTLLRRTYLDLLPKRLRSEIDQHNAADPAAP